MPKIGILFQNLLIASRSAQHFDQHLNKIAFRVGKDDKGKESMRWTASEGDKQVVFTHELYASFWKRLSVNLMRILPIDSML